MGISNIFYGLAVLGFCCVSLSSSLSCYVCHSTDCHNITVTRTCTAQLVAESKTYLSQHYSVNTTQMNNSSSQFICLRDSFVFNIGNSRQQLEYRGCLDKNIEACNYRPLGSNLSRRCTLCDGNNCNGNPASRLSVNAFAVLVMATIAKLGLGLRV